MAFLKKHKTTLFHANGIARKEYLTVPAALLKNTAALRKYFDTSFEYAKTLKPRPTA